MTKRFVMEDIGGIAIRIRDNVTVLTGERICEVLNALNDENEQLKSKVFEQCTQFGVHKMKISI